MSSGPTQATPTPRHSQRSRRVATISSTALRWTARSTSRGSPPNRTCSHKSARPSSHRSGADELVQVGAAELAQVGAAELGHHVGAVDLGRSEPRSTGGGDRRRARPRRRAGPWRRSIGGELVHDVGARPGARRARRRGDHCRGGRARTGRRGRARRARRGGEQWRGSVASWCTTSTLDQEHGELGAAVVASAPMRSSLPRCSRTAAARRRPPPSRSCAAEVL